MVLQPNNLELALESPKRNLFGQDVFHTLHEKAAALMHDLIKLHPFLDGNKRAGLIATIAFLELNNSTLRRDTDEAVDISIKTAECSADMSQIIRWIKAKSRRKT